MPRPRVLLADDHTIVLEGLRTLLAAEYDVLGEVQDGRALIEAATRLRPDVVVADIAMPQMNGIEVLRHLRAAGHAIKVVFITMHASVEFAVEAILLGASGYVLKHEAADQLLLALRGALNGDTYVPAAFEQDVTTALAERRSAMATGEPPRSPLTSREREVLQLIAEGHTAKEIAGTLKISYRTAEHHKYNIMEKLKLRTTAELTQYALGEGLIHVLPRLPRGSK